MQGSEQNQSPRGRLIVFEGIDGAGKTTQIELLEAYLRASGRPVWRTAEPTDSPYGRLLREALSGAKAATPAELAALFLADRIAHNRDPESGIEAKLVQGYDVICDRYYYSSLAYQGSETDPGWVRDMNLGCPEIRRPELCIFLDLTPEESMRRIAARGEAREIYESTERLARVRDKFFGVFAALAETDRICIVNAARPIREIQAEIRGLLER